MRGRLNTSAPITGCFHRLGACGFLVTRYFADITDRAKAAGDLATGYSEIYLTLAGMAVLCALLTLALRPPCVATQSAQAAVAAVR